MTAQHIRATVVVLTYNGADYLGQILDALSIQRVDGEFETLVLDSGSTDSTLDIVASHPEVLLHEIPNSEFGHGRTRNLAAQLARGEVVVYLTHDAVPVSDRWLHEMLAPFELNDRVVAVMGKQIPRPHCFPLLKYEIRQVFAGFGPDFGTSLFYKDDFIGSQAVYDAVTFYSDVNSAARRDVLVGDIPYRDVDYAEDQLFGRDVVDRGLLKAYAGRGAVMHSNDLTLAQYRKRMFDETVGLRRAGIDVQAPDGPTAARLTARGAIRDAVRILRDPDYSWKRKCYWLVVNPAFHRAKWDSVRHAVAVDLDDTGTISRHSLEHSLRTASDNPMGRGLAEHQ